MSKFSDFMSSLKYSIQRKAKNTLCLSHIHDWIYIFDEKGQPTIRYCENCRRQEMYSQVDEQYLRIKNISYSEI